MTATEGPRSRSTASQRNYSWYNDFPLPIQSSLGLVEMRRQPKEAPMINRLNSPPVS
jgi:hypothetical protein